MINPYSYTTTNQWTNMKRSLVVHLPHPRPSLIALCTYTLTSIVLWYSVLCLQYTTMRKLGGPLTHAAFTEGTDFMNTVTCKNWNIMVSNFICCVQTRFINLRNYISWKWPQFGGLGTTYGSRAACSWSTS